MRIVVIDSMTLDGVARAPLMRAGLVDEYVLLITPLVLGTGSRLFPDRGAFAKLHLVEATNTNTTTGAIIATYRSA
jgi:dihydrofolate reductase